MTTTFLNGKARKAERPPGVAAYRWAPYVLLGTWLTALWFSGVNRNLLFLIFNFALLVSLGGFSSDIRLRSGLFLAGALLPLVQIDYTPPNSIRVTNLQSTLIPADHCLNVVFPLYDWEKLQERCGIENIQLVLWARDYENIDIGLRDTQVAPQGVATSQPAMFPKEVVEAHGGRRAAKIQYTLNMSGEVKRIVVNLQSRNGEDPIEIMKGPETHGKKLYANAVYLSATGPRCRVVYHSSQATLKPRLPLAEDPAPL